MIKQFKKALVLAPHTDDGEFGCGGTVNRLVENGCEVHYAAFSSCRQSVPPQFPHDILITEVKAATQVLGINPGHLTIFDYDVRMFNYSRQPILDDILKLKKQIAPDLVFLPSPNDIHQDHATITAEGIRAFKGCSIFGYELLWNNFNFNTACFVSLEEKHVNKKIEAINEYKSQGHRPYSDTEFLKGQARVRGVQSGNQYAEAFEIIRLCL
jgi:LmbE family N-acetylglucosaminyl deacetylase